MSNNDLQSSKKTEDLLKFNNLDKNEYLVTAAVIEPPIDKVETKPKKATLMGAVLSAISLNKNDDLYSKIRPRKTLVSLILILVFTIFLYFFYEIADKKLILGVIAIFAAIAIPLLMITLNYEICPKKTFSFYNIIISFIFGIAMYIAIDAVVNAFLVKNIYRATIDSVIIPMVWGISELIFIALICKVNNISEANTSILLAISVGMGYATALALHELLNSLFVSVELIINEGTTSIHYVGSAIVDNINITQANIINTMDELIASCFFYPIAISCWSAVIGRVVVISMPGSKGKRASSFSYYLLVVLVIGLYMLSNFSTSFINLDAALKITSIIVSLFLGIKTINGALNTGLELNIEEDNI